MFPTDKGEVARSATSSEGEQVAVRFANMGSGVVDPIYPIGSQTSQTLQRPRTCERRWHVGLANMSGQELVPEPSHWELPYMTLLRPNGSLTGGFHVVNARV